MVKPGVAPAIHNIGLCGLTGVIFAVLTTALILYLEGFVTTGWATAGGNQLGLWQTCLTTASPESNEWMISTQVFASLGLAGVVIAFGLAVIYMSANRASKNITLVSLAAISFFAALFIGVSLGVYGVHRPSNLHLSWSYYVTLVAGLLSLLAGILSVVQIRKSNVRL